MVNQAGIFFMINSDKNKFNDMSNHPLIEIFKENDKGIPEELFILDQKYSMMFWQKLFGVSEERRCFPQNHWLNFVSWKSLELDWVSDYNQGVSKEVCKKLRSLVALKSNSEVYFFKDPYEVILTSWNFFTENWLEFLEYDDESYIFCEDINKLLLISPISDIRVLDLRTK